MREELLILAGSDVDAPTALRVSDAVAMLVEPAVQICDAPLVGWTRGAIELGTECPAVRADVPAGRADVLAPAAEDGDDANERHDGCTVVMLWSLRGRKLLRTGLTKLPTDDRGRLD